MSGETLHVFQNDEGDTVQMTFHPENFHDKALKKIAKKISSDPSITGILIDGPEGTVVQTPDQLERSRISPYRVKRQTRLIYTAMQEAERVTLIANPQHITPPPLHFTNLAPEEASKIIGAATTNPRMEISCAFYNARNGQLITSVTRNPYEDARQDLQGELGQLYEYMQGNEQVITRTTVRKR